jgi:hypothetical protein
MFTQEQIQLEFKRLAEKHQEIELLNFYQGFPITCKASILQINEDAITLKAQARRSACLVINQDSWILCGSPLDAIHATIASFDILNGLVSFTNFSASDTRLGKRMNARVVPRERTDVVIQTSQFSIIEQMADISMSGIGVIFNDPLSRMHLEQGEEVLITARLPVGIIHIHGKIQAITHTGDLSRLSIVFIENTPAINLILRYISNRRIEIIDEIEKLYYQFYQERLLKLQSP